MAGKFLIAHPDTTTVRTLEIALRDDHHNTRIAHEGLDAIDRALDDKPDGIILGLDLPGLNGLDVARALRSLQPTMQIPILFITRDAEEGQTIARADLPLVDWMTAPLDLGRLQQESELMLHPHMPTPELRAVDPDKELAAISDPLTGLYERHYVLHRLAYEAARARRYETSLSCIVFGLDNLDELVERYGRIVGDRVLMQGANIFRRAARITDVIGRTGMDRFVVIAPETDDLGARQFARRLREALVQHRVDLPPDNPFIDASVGVASAPGTSLADNLALLGRAEGAQLRARTEKAAEVVVG